MVDQLFSLFQASPLMSVILLFVTVIIAMILFREQLRALIKKHFKLYDEKEIITAVRYSIDDQSLPMINDSEKSADNMEYSVMKYLKEFRNDK